MKRLALGLLLIASPAAADVPAESEPPVPPGASVSPEPTEPMTGDVLLEFRGRVDPSPAAVQRLAADPRVSGVERLIGAWPVYRLVGAPELDPAAFARELAARPGIAWAEPDRFMDPRPHDPRDEPMWDELWHLENTGVFPLSRPQADVHAVPAWEITSGAGVIIGVIDSGVELDHPDLDVTEEGWDAYERDGLAEPDIANTDNPGHGTAVAGVAAAIGDNGIGTAGVAWGARIYPVRMLGGTGLTLGDMYEAMVAPVDAGAGVVNNSWGMIDGECSDVPSYQPLNNALEYARIEGRGGLGAVVVFSAGNSGCEVDVYPMQTQPGVLAVGSLRHDDTKFGYSVWGEMLDIMAVSGPLGGGGSHQALRSTDLSGDPGLNGRGENREYTHRMGGTSGAAPVLSGAIALMLAANPRITEADVRRVLCDTAVRVNPTVAAYDEHGWSPTYGCGRVDAGAAVTAVADDGPPPAPEILRPADGGDQLVGDVVLRWDEAVDPDGGPVRYDVEIVDLSLDDDGDDDAGDDDAGDDDDSAAAPGLSWTGLTEPALDLSGELLAGEYAARVWARDDWGRGEGSEPVGFFVVSPPPPPPPDDDDPDDCTCSSASSEPTGLALGLILCAALRRRGARARWSTTGPRPRA